MVSNAIREVSSAIVDNLVDRHIKFPDINKRANIKRQYIYLIYFLVYNHIYIFFRFYQKHGIPGVIGLVDGTHISIKKPKKKVEFVYYATRKSSHTKNVQVVIRLHIP